MQIHGRLYPPAIHLPFTPSEEMSILGITTYPDASFAHRYFALLAESKIDKAPRVIVQAEAPFRDLSINPRSNSKIAQEMRDVRTFLGALMVDKKRYRIHPGPHPNTPPDVIAEFGEKSVSIEATQLHLPASDSNPQLSGVGLAKTFEYLVDYIAAQGNVLRPQLQAHRGYLLFLSFGESQGPSSGLPPRRGDERRMSEVVDFLRETKPPPSEFVPIYAKHEIKYRHDSVKYNANRTVGSTWHLVGPPPPTTSLWKALGFELGLLHNRDVRQSDAIRELQRLVRKHDSDTLEYLVVTIGSPTKDGWLYPSDHACAHLLRLTEDPLGGYRPRHVRNIALHDLTRGEEVRWILGDRSGIPN